MAVPLVQMQWVGETPRSRIPEYQEYQARRGFWVRGRGRGRFSGRSRGRGCGRSNAGGNRSQQAQAGSFEIQGKEKEVVSDSKNDIEPMKEDQGDDLYDDEFVEEDDMAGVVSILPADFANNSEAQLDGDFYDPS
ncbi:hypothetical protein PIB30_053261 [Stylosanthes scabra]|uniref:Uncharacterized protein n=1 Tax=Stylosanthes scabra TaxID=79078 RepID=A0ABU6ZH99_9FABA|nr:hypothetical protein [Stylosanthes scabra]